MRRVDEEKNSIRGYPHESLGELLWLDNSSRASARELPAYGLSSGMLLGSGAFGIDSK